VTSLPPAHTLSGPGTVRRGRTRLPSTRASTARRSRRRVAPTPSGGRTPPSTTISRGSTSDPVTRRTARRSCTSRTSSTTKASDRRRRRLVRRARLREVRPLAAVSVAQLLLAYERNPDVFESGTLGIDAALADGTVHDSLPGLLAETRFELGGWRRCSARTGPSTRRSPAPSGPRSPRRRRTPSSGTCSACRRSAPPSSPARWHSPPASTRRTTRVRCSRPSRTRRRPGRTSWTPESYFRHDDGQSSGSTSYRKPGNLGDGGDRFWAAAELLKTTGESQYADYLEREHADQFSARPWPVEWYRTFPLGQWAYYTADAAAPDRRSSVGDAFREYADNEVQQIRRDGYNVALTEGQYYWGRRGSPSPRRSSFSWRTPSRPTRAYVEAALDQVHYVLGRTPTTKSYVTGVGKNPPEHPHDRLQRQYRRGRSRLPRRRSQQGRRRPGARRVHRIPATAAGEGVPRRPGAFAANSVSSEYSAPLVFALSHFTVGDAVQPPENEE